MKSTSFAFSPVNMAAKSPCLSTAGPEVILRLHPISFAMAIANVVFPNPGGP